MPKFEFVGGVISNWPSSMWSFFLPLCLI